MVPTELCLFTARPRTETHNSNIGNGPAADADAAAAARLPRDHLNLNHNRIESSQPLGDHSQCDRPQLAHRMYQRLLSIAQRNYAQHQITGYSPTDIRLAAFTGARLVFAGSSSTQVATSLDDD